ncbi:uncharacterized protein LOC117785704 [Drosophila innubila]|uniref:uncharacterized protein LOC117785704 n=1 Tax=Drosophila innubila TaxID=198719 RepID=UPI00148D1E11|nr:uncharacterized protein LOC117785704 [Drosophila innubila]
MANPCRWCNISSSFLLEANVIILALGCVFMVDLYNHFHLKRNTLPHINTSLNICLSVRLFIIRSLTIVGYLSSGIMGIIIARSLTIFKFASYVLLNCMTLIFTLAIGLSQYVYKADGRYYSNMMLHDLWTKNHIEPLEALFDCCGKHGAIDYEIANRTWSKASCCELPNCEGCENMFFEFLNSLEMEIARDNIILFVFLFIALLLIIVHYMNLQLDVDPYVSEDEDDIESDSDSSSLKHKP